MTLVYEQTDYRSALKKRFQQLKTTYKSKYRVQTMADACQVQSPYMSRVLGGHVHLNEDQLFLAFEFLELDQNERHYLQLLHAYQRSVVALRKKSLLAELETIRRRFKKTEENIQTEVVREIDRAEFFLSPELQLIYTFFSIPAFRKEPERIRQNLRLGRVHFNQCIEKLTRMELLKYGKSGLEMQKLNLHLSVESALNNPYQQLLKSYSYPQVSSLAFDQKYSLAALFASNKTVAKEARKVLLEAIQKIQKMTVESSSVNSVYQVNVDFFPWVGGD